MTNSCIRFHRRHVIPYWRTFIVVFTPLLLLPLPLFVDGSVNIALDSINHRSRIIASLTQEARAGYGVLLMTIFWLTSAMPLAVTSLLPIVVFPLLDVLSTSQVCSLYFKEANVVFFGGVVLALGVERSNLHSRIALRAILIVGTNPRWYYIFAYLYNNNIS